MTLVLSNQTTIPSIFSPQHQQPIQSRAETLTETVESKLKLHMTFIKNLQNKHEEFIDIASGCPVSKESLNNLFVALNTMYAHCSFLLKVLNSQSEAQVASIKHDFPCISKFYPTLNTSSDICLLPLNEVLAGVVSSTLKNIKKILKGVFFEQDFIIMIKKCQDTQSKVKILTAKLEAIILYFPGTAVMEQDDIFIHPKTSSVWEKLYSATTFRKLGEKKDIDKSLQIFCNVVVLANALAHKGHEVEKSTGSPLMGKVAAAMSMVSYIASFDKARTQASLLFANPKMENAFKVWSIPDHKIVKKLFVLTLPSIGYDKKIYLPRIFPRITKESILKEYESGKQNTITPSSFQAPDLTSKKEEILSTIFDKNKERVKVRVIAPDHLNIGGSITGKVKSTMSWLLNKIPFNQKAKSGCNGVIIHIHGGGFVSMSSSAHRLYLYKWAKALNMIIFSIDYSLAPANPYPEALDDVWQAYNWLINYAEPILGVSMDKVVVAGDSAGGNLAASVALRAIKEGVRVPDGCFLGYPALSLFPQKVIPSYFVSIESNILPYNVMSLCLKAYIPEEFKPESDPFLSPLVASDELLSKMPAVRIVTGNDDPLHDDNWKFLHRLQNMERNVEMTVYEGVPHGFLTMNDLVGYETLIDETVDRLKQLFQNANGKVKTPNYQIENLNNL